MTLYWHPPREGRPADILPPRSGESIRAETFGLIRGREQEHAEERAEWAMCIQSLTALHEADLAEQAQQHADAFAALAHSEALATEATAARTLARVVRALVVFEARAQRDPAGAARALLRWIRKASGA